MTITAKLVDVGGDEFVVSDETDITDINGFSDVLAVVGAETAKFSGGGTMQANSGLRIGLKQLRINAGVLSPRTRSIVVGSDTGTTNATNMINGSLTVPGATRTAIGQYAIIDFSSVDTQLLKVNYQNQNVAQTYTFKTEIANAVGGPYTDLGNTFVPGGQTNTTLNLGSQTWQFVRMTLVSQSGASAGLNINEVFEDNVVSDTVTVRVRSSTSIDTANGTVLITDQVMSASTTLTFDSNLLLTDASGFVTLEIVSFSGFAIPVTLDLITSVTEV